MMWKEIPPLSKEEEALRWLQGLMYEFRANNWLAYIERVKISNLPNGFTIKYSYGPWLEWVKDA